jgi:hypothetical protein
VPSALTSPRLAEPSLSSTTVPASAAPVNEMVELLSTAPCVGAVMVGVAGATVSTRTVRPAEVPEVPPAFVAVAVYVWLPSVTPESVRFHRPEIEAVVAPRTVEPSRTVTVAPACAVPESEKADVRLQPLSTGDEITGVEGAGVTTLPTVSVRGAESEDVLRAMSVARAVNACRPLGRLVTCRDHVPLDTETVPCDTPFTYVSTIVPFSEVPDRATVLATPDPSAGETTAGATGASVSTRTTTMPDAAEVPLASLAVALSR